jgi:hypothetical protein
MPDSTTVIEEKLIDNEFASLIYYPKHKIVHHIFKKPMSSETVRHVLLTGIEALKKNSANKWLSDDRGNGALSEEDTQWGINTWFPTAKAAGWQYWALVVPNDHLGRINMTQFVMNYAQQGIRVAVFTEADKAREWLETL